MANLISHKIDVKRISRHPIEIVRSSKGYGSSTVPTQQGVEMQLVVRAAESGLRLKLRSPLPGDLFEKQ